MKPTLPRFLQDPTRQLMLLAAIIFALGFGLRLFDLTDQPLDFHPTRQLRGAIIARGMFFEMSPAFDDATRQQAINFWRSTGQYEPSILERLTALTYLLIGREYIWIARLYNTLFWMIGGAAVFVLARRMAWERWADEQGGLTQQREHLATGSALVALAYFLLLPFAVEASRAFQPDPMMVMWLVLFAYALYRWAEKLEWRWALLCGLLGGVAILTKAVAAFPVGGACTALVIYQTKSRASERVHPLRNPQVWVIAIVLLAPSAIYYLGRGGRATDYISGWTLALSHLLIEPWFYLRWANLVQKLMTPVALLLGLLGVIIARKQSRALLVGLWLGYLAYGLFLPYQMYTHNYYHLQVVPLAALSLVPIAQLALERISRLHNGWKIAMGAFAIGVLLLSVWAATIPMRAQDNRSEPPFWEHIASYLPTDGKIIALTQDYGYRLMYYGWRKVLLWPNRGEQNLSQLRGSEKEFASYFDKRTKDVSYFLITAFRQFDDQPDLKKHLHDNFPILAEGDGYIIFDLANPLQ